MNNSIDKNFGELVFNDSVMRTRLPKDYYKAVKRVVETGKHLDLDVANVVANAMKDWAIEKGATHFTHWFQPMTGVTAEKHDCFIAPDGEDGVIMEFKGKELIESEPDASSFPSGGLRSTFEARGYTAWDPTSYAFIKEKTLYIPTAFCSYSGEALDKKTPLLRSMQALDKEAVRLLKLLGDDATSVGSTVGAEQEYFIIDEKAFKNRPDLVNCGRTLIGFRPPKGQELEDHYFGAIPCRVKAFMEDLDDNLWKLGIMAKTEHNEVAPAQHELAPIYVSTNMAADQNQLTMELMKTIAAKHGLACLLHEKPFEGVNGSGKHNNWSLSTDKGENLFEPGKTPAHNMRFLLFFMGAIESVDKHQDLLRIAVASAGNDHRLGANEAPPAIISVFIGAELNSMLEAIESGKDFVGKGKSMMEIGAKVLPHIPKDSTDRNRTSPFAFTGNKFEFRMLGSNASISSANIVLNTIMAETLSNYADKLEKADNIEECVSEIVKETLKEHKRIIFNGNNYSDEWKVEAEKRGLLNLPSTVDALPYFISDSNIKLFEKFGVFTNGEMNSRYEILLENYINTVNIEALTMIDMIKKEVLNSAITYEDKILTVADKKSKLGIDRAFDKAKIEKVSAMIEAIDKKLAALESSVELASTKTNVYEKARVMHDKVLEGMNLLRSDVDTIEGSISRELWPYMSYYEILTSAR